jgi:hypothetical protein
MKTEAKRIIPLATLAIVLFSISPLAYASTLAVSLNPKTGLAEVDGVSTTTIVFTYPANSTISDYLRNVSSSMNLKGSFDGTASGTHELQGSFDAWDRHVSVSNMSVAVNFSAVGNKTTLVVDKATNVNATVSGTFSVVNGSVTADLGWRAFVIGSALDLPLDGRIVDVNLAGSAMENSLGSHGYAALWLFSTFGGGPFWNRPTLNFSALDSPLSTWTKNYNAATNTTTFSKTISGQDTYSVKANYNGESYSFSAVSDPSGVISVEGYANASGDSLVMAPAPTSAATSVIAAAVVVGLLILTGGYLLLRSRARARVSTETSAMTPV